MKSAFAGPVSEEVVVVGPGFGVVLVGLGPGVVLVGLGPGVGVVGPGFGMVGVVLLLPPVVWPENTPDAATPTTISTVTAATASVPRDCHHGGRSGGGRPGGPVDERGVPSSSGGTYPPQPESSVVITAHLRSRACWQV
jgi:hypothetical protein